MKCTQQTYAYDPYSVRVTRVTSFWQSLHRSVWYVQDVYLQRALVLPVLDAELLWIFTSPFSEQNLVFVDEQMVILLATLIPLILLDFFLPSPGHISSNSRYLLKRIAC